MVQSDRSDRQKVSGETFKTSFCEPKPEVQTPTPGLTLNHPNPNLNKNLRQMPKLENKPQVPNEINHKLQPNA